MIQKDVKELVGAYLEMTPENKAHLLLAHATKTAQENTKKAMIHEAAMAKKEAKTA